MTRNQISQNSNFCWKKNCSDKVLLELAPLCYFGVCAFPSSIYLVSRKDDRSTVETFPIIINHYRNSYNFFFHQYTWEETVSSLSSILDRHFISHVENRGLQADEARTLINPHYNVNACNTFIHNSYAEGSELFPSTILGICTDWLFTGCREVTWL